MSGRAIRNGVASALVLAGLCALPVQAQTPEAGVMPGTLSVEESGAASYSVPIAVVPGTAGMQPSLSLNYSSQAGNGLMGVGWSLGGLSIIHRCATTLEQDGFIDGVDFDANDKFCLDGQRLVAISGTYGADGTEYRTEIDGFAKIVSNGTAGSGPQKFKVWTKSGQIIQYGYSTSSRIEAQGRTDVFIWAVNRIDDTVGNYMTFSYIEDSANGEYVPDKIDYTGNTPAAKSPYVSVRFVYETRPDQIVSYVSGSKVSLSKRLTKVQTYSCFTCVAKEYRIAYDNGGAAGRSRVASLTECDNANKCFAPVTLGWQGQATGFAPQTRWFQSSHNLSNMPRSSSPIGEGDYNILLDMNGDGLPDRVSHYDYDTGQGYGLWVQLSTGSGFAAKSRWYQSPNNGMNMPRASDNNGSGDYVILLDMNGDSLPDRVSHYDYQTGQGYGLWVQLNTGNGFATKSRWYQSPNNAMNKPRASDNNGGGDYVILLDMNGDGLPDRVSHYDYQTGQGYGLWVQLNTGNGFATKSRWYQSSHNLSNMPRSSSPIGEGDYNILLDMNGDGLPDRVSHYDYDTGQGYGLWVQLSTGSGFAAKSRWYQSPNNGMNMPRASDNNGSGDYVILLDMNGDSLPDRVSHYDYQTGQGYGLWVQLNTGNGFATKSRWYLSPSNAMNKPRASHNTGGGDYVILLDMNGDSLPDRVSHYDYDTGQGSGLWVHLNTGTGFAPHTRWYQSSNIGMNMPRVSDNNGGGDYVILMDMNGDGLSDRVSQYDYDTAQGYGLWVHTSSGALDLLSSLTDSLGRVTSLTYKPITDASVHTKGTGAVYPEVDIQAPAYVVSAVSADDGVGGQAVTTYRYEGARVHVKGRGFLGFAVMESTDALTGVVTRTTFRQDHPYIGQVASSETYLPSGPDKIFISRLNNEWATKSLNGGATQAPYVATATAESFEINDGVQIP